MQFNDARNDIAKTMERRDTDTTRRRTEKLVIIGRGVQDGARAGHRIASRVSIDVTLLPRMTYSNEEEGK